MMSSTPMTMNDVESLIHQSLRSLRDTSLDSDNDRYLCNDLRKVVCFDEVKRLYANSRGYSEDKLASVDAVFQSQGKRFFVEFKSKVSKCEKFKVKRKASDSILIYLDLFGISLGEFCRGSEFILVTLEEDPKTKEDIEGYERFADSIMALSDAKELVGFTMLSLKGIHFSDVHTYTVEKFNEFLDRHKDIAEISVPKVPQDFSE